MNDLDNIRTGPNFLGMDENQVTVDQTKARIRKHSKNIPSQDIIHHIDMAEIKFLKAIGKGSFGVVHKAIWSGRTVAVKKVETATEVNAFQNEIKQLAKVKHENIITMYGTGSSVHAKCLVMEFASDGSLYQLLHCPPLLKYNLSHALGWLLQCAKAIAYLHSISPTPVIHRDLKPLNMLLTEDMKVLKICDFGTACDLRSVMTENRGSTVWMAPEVIKGSNYNEKCDVYSWGIILWELLTRRMPFKELGQIYRILWKVVNKERPPLIQGCPKPIEKLMMRCWIDEQSERPSMQDIVEIVCPLYKMVCGIEDANNQLSSGDSYTESCTSSLNEEMSENHTSHDVSEFTTGTNVDAPNQSTDESRGSTPFVVTSNINNINDMEDEFSENVNQHPEFQHHNIISPVSPSILALPRLGRNQPEVNSSTLMPPSSGRISFVHPPPPEMHTPLSVAIPNEGPAEREDIALASPGRGMLEEHSDIQLIPKFPWIVPPPFPPINDPKSPSVCSARQLIDATKSPNSSCFHPLHSSDSPLSYNVPCLTTCLATPASYSDQASASTAGYMRQPLHSHASSRVWRRSAEVPYNHSIPNPDPKGHKRSSSYEFSNLIGFEPLAAETLSESDCSRNSDWTSPENRHQIGKQQTKVGLGEFVESLQNSTNALHTQENISPSSISGVCLYDTDIHAVPAKVTSYGSDTGINNRGVDSAGHLVSSPKSSNVQSVYVQRPLQRNSSPYILGTEDDDLGAFWQLLEDDLKPAMPMPSCTQSQQIFNDHKGLAHQMFVVQEEIVYLDQEKKKLLMKLDDHVKDQQACRQRYSDKITQLKSRNENLRLDYCRLSKQLEEIRSRRQQEESRNVYEVPEAQQLSPNAIHFCAHNAPGLQALSPRSQGSLR